MKKKLYEELHARPPIPIEAPKLISTIAFMVEDESQSSSTHEQTREYLSVSEINHFISDVCNYFDLKEDINLHIPHPKEYNSFDMQQSIYTKADKKDLVVFQNHMSFFCITFLAESTGSPKWNAIPPDLKKGICNWDDIISRAVFKTHLNVQKHDLTKIEKGYHLKDIFDSEAKTNDKINNVFIELLGSKVSDGKAFVWTPFRSFVCGDGFNRILVSADINFKSERLGRLVRRVIEIDLYTTIACRNFHTSRKQLKELRQVEKKISETLGKLECEDRKIGPKIQQLRNLDKKIDELEIRKECTHAYLTRQNDLRNELKSYTEKYREYYEKIGNLAKENAGIILVSRYDFQAVLAYSDLVSQRIKELREEYLEGWTRISYFLERTFSPGVRTCQAVLELQNSVSQQIQGAANLLEAGLSLQLQEQEGKTLEQHNEILGKVEEIMRTQQSSEQEERKFERNVELIALFPIAYYVSYIIYKISDLKLSWLIFVPITLILSFWLLFTPTGNKKIENLLKRFNPPNP